MNKQDDPVTEPLCQARREVIIERIEGLKKTIYVSTAAMTTTIIIVQFILTLIKS